ncbi:hypothetical protein LSCM1_06434 [Leishmania martiniquensis]|uniref:Uncharacterized protein n=1 Tax=Leishmania martiniquensis TaxID=1580590 RepID=A0A836GTT4_9TRYP|nr:hypothetical protein LSCM1_06434 [Leishmania martiniquensis]
MEARAPKSSGVTAESLYRDVVWPALWKVLQLASPPSTPANAYAGASSGAAEHVRCARCLQRAVTQALVQLLRTACRNPVTSSMSGVPLAVLHEVVSHLLLHPHGSEQAATSQFVPEEQRGVLDSAEASPAAAAAAVEVERLYLLVCAAIQLSAQMDVSRVAAFKIASTTGAGAASATAAGITAASQLPWGVAQASKSVVAGIFALSSCINSSPASSPLSMASDATPSVLGPPPSSMAAAASPQQLQQQQLSVHHLWLTFLFVYLQQLSSHTPKDTTAYGRFFASCGNESRRRLAITPVLTDSDDDGVDISGAIMRQSTAASEIAALQAWSNVSVDLLRDTIARTRFRRAALLFKSYVPHMLMQAPTMTFLLADALSEFARSWTALTRCIPAGCMAEDVVCRLARYDTRSVVRDDHPNTPSQQWQQCVDLLRAYGDRLTLLLGTGTLHGHLVATTLCAVLSALYVLPHTRVCAPMPSAAEAGPTTAGAAAAARGKRDEEAAVLEIEAAHRQPRRTSILSIAGSATTPPDGGESLISEAEWRLRHYAPFGQLLAYARILELQKVHLFAVTTAQLRVGRSVAQQVEHTRMLALAALYCGVAGWDLTVLMYHFAECPLNPFGGPDTLPPALPTSALARYTASVQQYVELTRAELIMDVPFTELRAHDCSDGGGGGRAVGPRHHGMRRGGVALSEQPQQQRFLPHSSSSSIPSRGELRTRRFMRIVHPDPVLLNWRLHLTATEALVATAATPDSHSAAAVGGGSISTAAAATNSLTSSPSTTSVLTANSASGSASAGSGVSDVLLSPCCLIRDVLVSGQYALAAAGMRYLADPPVPRVAGTQEAKAGAHSVNVLLLPRRAYPQHISVTYYLSTLLRRWLQRWEVADQQRQMDRADTAAAMQLRDEAYHVLSSFVPILSVAQSHMANQSLLVRLLVRMSRMCETTVAAAVTAAAAATAPAPGVAMALSSGGVVPPSPNAVLALAERLLIVFVMPCVRVLPPAPMVYDVMEDVLRLFARVSVPDLQARAVLPYGENAAMPLHMFDWLQELLPSVKFVVAYRTKQQLLQMEALQGWPPSPRVHPHDALLRKEREALLSQSLKRLNAENLEEYRALLRPILYAEPLLVAHRLFIQAVGYNNNFLDIHTRLLRGLPGAVLMLIVQQGLLLMTRYAAEERVAGVNGGENRVAVLATFLATLWRDNLDTVDGTLLVRHVELALRSNSGDSLLLGTELCKALLAVMAHRALEHEEKYNPVQLQALAYSSATTSLFGRGTMTSFRVGYWKDTASSAQLLLSPVDVFVGAQRVLLAALRQPCLVPTQGDEEVEGNEEEHRTQPATAASSEHRFTLGQQTLLHLCRLQSCIYELQRDLDGGAELILLSSAERYNTINDMLLVLEEMSPPPTERTVLEHLCARVHQVALPHVASLIETQQRRKFEWALSSASSGGAMPSDAVYGVPAPVSVGEAVGTVDAPVLPPVAQLLQYFTAAHFEYSPDPYNASRYEWQQCMERAQGLAGQDSRRRKPAVSASTRRAVSIMAWLNAEAERIDAEECMHKHLHTSSAAARAALLQLIERELASPSGPLASEADDRLLELAVSYLLPRAVLNLREAATVAAFFTWLFQEATPSRTSAAAVGHDESAQERWSLHCRAIDLALTFVTAAFTFFVGFTDGECKRLGCVLQRLLQIPSLSAHQQQLDAAARLSPLLLKCIRALSARARPGNEAAAAVGAGARVLGDRDGCATEAISPGNSAAGGAGAAAHGDSAAVKTGGLRAVSCSVFERFLPAAHGGLINGNGSSSRERAGPASLLSLAIARGLVSSAAQPNEPLSAASPAVDAAAGALPAVPLQLESHLSRAMIQLLTHEQDVPAYAHRNLFLVLEQLDKSTFPATLCAVDLLTRAVEPHASKAKSYYALASAVLKLLRMNRRHARELQHVIAALRHGDEGAALSALQTVRCDEDGGALLEARAAAVTFHGQWRLSEHYMRQLLQNEVAALLEAPQARHRVDDDSEGDEENAEGSRYSETEKDAADGASRSSSVGEGNSEGSAGDELSVAASAHENGEEDEARDNSRCDEDASSMSSEDVDEEHDNDSDQAEYADSGDDDDALPASRKRRREE